MRVMRRPIAGWGMRQHQTVSITPGFGGGRPCSAWSTPMAPQFSANMSGPRYNGMDPSDPATWPRPYDPQPGMIAQLNFDGAARQAQTPTGGLQRGKTPGGRPRKLRMGGM